MTGKVSAHPTSLEAQDLPFAPSGPVVLSKPSCEPHGLYLTPLQSAHLVMKGVCICE